jgi:hypothetical protein
MNSRSSRPGAEGIHWDPIREGLRQLGILHSKKSGIPDAYMNAKEDDRLAVIAGLIDSSCGSYDESNNRYTFSQRDSDQTKIVYDLQALARSCGISASEVRQFGVGHDEIDGDPAGEDFPLYCVDLTEGCAKFQHHLRIPRKKMPSALLHP